MIDSLHQASAFGGDDVLTFAAGSAFAGWLGLVEEQPAADTVLDRLQRSGAGAPGLRDVLSFETGRAARGRLAATTARQIDQREYATATAGRALPFGARRTSNERRLAGGRAVEVVANFDGLHAALAAGTAHELTVGASRIADRRADEPSAAGIDRIHVAGALGRRDVVALLADSTLRNRLGFVQQQPAAESVFDRLQRCHAVATGLRNVLSFETRRAPRGRLAALAAGQFGQGRGAAAPAGRILAVGAERRAAAVAGPRGLGVGVAVGVGVGVGFTPVLAATHWKFCAAAREPSFRSGIRKRPARSGRPCR